jgi:phenylacetate-CoA ligase
MADRQEVLARQRARLRELVERVVPANRFVTRKLEQAGLTAGNLCDDFRQLPPTTKQELIRDQEESPPYGTNLTYPLGDYVRLHQTSGTQGKPLRWLDTAESWDWMLGCWRKIFDIVGVKAADRLFFPFSFGPFLGFWTAFEAAGRLGCLCLAAGGMSTVARLRMLLDNQATVMLCTPTYALHLAQVAAQEKIDIAGCVKKIIVAGEPGGSIPATRARIESAWGARLFDHSGMTEIGPMTIECPQSPGGLHVLEEDYLIEVVNPATLAPLESGPGELLVTNLGRVGSPLFRYRTGDLVRVGSPCECGLPYLRLEGGILGRTDDMIAIRGNNFYPSALENVLRRFVEVVEYRVQVDASSPLAELRIEVEPASEAAGLAEKITRAIRDELYFRAEVLLVPPGSLPRFEMKARRVIK